MDSAWERRLLPPSRNGSLRTRTWLSCVDLLLRTRQILSGWLPLRTHPQGQWLRTLKSHTQSAVMSKTPCCPRKKLCSRNKPGRNCKNRLLSCKRFLKKPFGGWAFGGWCRSRRSACQPDESCSGDGRTGRQLCNTSSH